MEVKKENLANSELKIIVSLNKDECAGYVQKAATKLSQKTTIPGFRPGHVPFETMVQKHGYVGLLQAAIDDIVRDKLFNIIQEDNLEVIGQPNIAIEKMSEDDGLSFCATITLLPEVKYKDFKKVKYTEPKIIINDEEVEKVINDLRDYQATKASVKRPAQTGDRVEVDYQLTLAGVPVENGQQKNFSFIIGKKQVLPEFENSVLSLEINGEKEFVLTFPDDYFAKHLAGKKVDAKITVRNILARSLPELNDVFSKKVGQETVVALRSAIKDNLYQEKYRGANLAAEQKMIEQAIAVATYSSIPDLLINNEVEKMIVELKSQISQQGIKFEDYILRLGKKEEGLRLEFVPKALERVKASLLLRAIAKNENINVDHEEVHKEINKHLANVKDEKIKERLQSNEWHEYVETYLRQEKVIKWLKEKCK